MELMELHTGSELIITIAIRWLSIKESSRNFKWKKIEIGRLDNLRGCQIQSLDLKLETDRFQTVNRCQRWKLQQFSMTIPAIEMDSIHTPLHWNGESNSMSVMEFLSFETAAICAGPSGYSRVYLSASFTLRCRRKRRAERSECKWIH